jgi:hypothetical protein
MISRRYASSGRISTPSFTKNWTLKTRSEIKAASKFSIQLVSYGILAQHQIIKKLKKGGPRTSSYSRSSYSGSSYSGSSYSGSSYLGSGAVSMFKCASEGKIDDRSSAGCEYRKW